MTNYVNEELRNAEKGLIEAKAKLKEERKIERGTGLFGLGDRHHLGVFVVGALAGTILKSQPVRKLLVNAVAAGMKIEKEALAEFHSIKDEANDIVHDASTSNNL